MKNSTKIKRIIAKVQKIKSRRIKAMDLENPTFEDLKVFDWNLDATDAEAHSIYLNILKAIDQEDEKEALSLYQKLIKLEDELYA